MELRQLELFLATCEEQSFTAAARRCGIAQSALSARVADLERELDAQLIDRATRPITLTKAGEIMLQHARRMISQSQVAVAEIAGLRGALTGQLRLGMVNVVGFSSPETEAALAQFHQRHPLVELVISDPASRAIVEGVRTHHFDLGFVGLRPELVPEGLAYRLIASVPVVAVVATSHVLADRASVTLRQLVESGQSIDLRQGTGLRYEVDLACSRAGVSRGSSMAVSTTDEAIRYAALGFGFTLLPRSAVDMGHRRPNVVVLPLRDIRINHLVALIYPVEGPTSPAARALLRELESRIPLLAAAEGR